EQPRGIQLSRHVSKFPLNPLKLRDRLAELMALLDIAASSVKGPAPNPQRKRGDGDAAAVQNTHGVDKTLPLLAQQIFARNLAVLKNKLRRVAGAQAKLVLFLTRAK